MANVKYRKFTQLNLDVPVQISNGFKEWCAKEGYPFWLGATIILTKFLDEKGLTNGEQHNGSVPV